MNTEIETWAAAQNWPPELAAHWAARCCAGGAGAFTPLQREAWAAGLDRDSKHWLISAPTGSGKGFLAEMLAARTLLEGRAVLWLVPTRALARATHAALEASFAPLGLRVGLATGETAREPVPRRFDGLIATYEKALSWLAGETHALARVGLVVADELTLLHDAERGGRLDLLLTLILASPYSPRRIGLCAPCANAAALAAWWRAERLESQTRPHPLQEGIFNPFTGRFRWLDRLTQREDQEQLAAPDQVCEWLGRVDEILERDADPLLAGTLALAGGLAARGEPTLLFAPTRTLARSWAQRLGQAFGLPAVPASLTERLEQLTRLDPCRDHIALANCLAQGAAFHHGDLNAEARALLEAAAASGEVTLIVATPTLAQGVNLATRNVIHYPFRPFHAVDSALGPDHALEVWRYTDQAGRAGRLGRCAAPGRSLLVAPHAHQERRLWTRYILGAPEPLEPTLREETLGFAVLLGLAGEVSRSEASLAAFLDGTAAMQLGGQPQRERLTEQLRVHLERAVQAGLIFVCVPAEGAAPAQYRLTPAGEVCVAMGLSPQRAEALLKLAAGAAHGPDPLPLIAGLALAAAPECWPGVRGRGRSNHLAEFAAWVEYAEAPPAPEALRMALQRTGGPIPAERVALEAAWRLRLWIGELPMPELEQRTQWTAGMLARGGERLAWLGHAVASLAAVTPAAPEAVLPADSHAHKAPDSRAEAWRALALRLGSGVQSEGLALAGLLGSEIGRSGLRRLIAARLDTLKVLAEAPASDVADQLGSRDIARQIQRRARKAVGITAAAYMRRDAPGGSESMIGISAAAAPVCCVPLLEFARRSPGFVRINGREVQIAPLGFELLAALAEKPGRVVTREALYRRLWGAEGPEDQQLDAHRRRLLNALGPEAGEETDAIVQVVRGVGFRLNLPAERVQYQRT